MPGLNCPWTLHTIWCFLELYEDYGMFYIKKKVEIFFECNVKGVVNGVFLYEFFFGACKAPTQVLDNGMNMDSAVQRCVNLSKRLVLVNVG
jgi:hypothetical protein